MSVTLVIPEQEPMVLDCRTRGAMVKAEALSLRVSSEETKTTATALLGACRKIQKDAEAKRVSLVKPLNDHVKAINDLFREVLAPFVEADKHLDGQLLARRREEIRLAAEATAAAERQRLEAEAMLREAERAEAAGKAAIAESLLDTAVAREQGARIAEVQAQAPARVVRTAAGTSSVRKTWTFKVLDPEAIPREYLELNEACVRKAIMAGVREIPGIEVYQEESLSVRT
ncbi:MAG: hypothetical protein Q8R92_05525 [Deltaproteobacteria bacterium]|nr:hypothetical protein [Deltaproteobacteria bacterium]